MTTGIETWYVGEDTQKKDHFVNKPTGQLHEFYLSGTIGEPGKYIEWFNTMRHAQEGDVIMLYINSYGGDLYTALQFMPIIRATEATVVAQVEGACMSAATLIALSCESFVISAESSWMIHNYSGGTMGKGGEMVDQVTFERKWSQKFMKEAYHGFLTAKEIQSVLDGRDLWLDADEVIKRLTRKAKAAGKEVRTGEAGK